MNLDLPGYVAVPFAIGMGVPVVIASLTAGYILGTFMVDRASKTVLGIHIRHFMARISPTKFFPEDTADERLIVETIRKAVASGKLNLKD